MFTIVLLILMIYFFYFGFNIYYDLVHRPKLDKDPNYFVQYEIDKPEKSQREEVLQKDFAGILKPNSPRLSKSPTAPLSNPRTSSHSFTGETITPPVRNLTPSKFSRFSRWREEAKRKKIEQAEARVQEENSRFHASVPVELFDQRTRKERLDAVSRRVFENINRNRQGAKQKEIRLSESTESPKPSQVHEMPENVLLQPITEVRSKVAKKVSAKESRNAPSTQPIFVSEPDTPLPEDPVVESEIPIGKGEKVEAQDTKARWRHLMNLAETSIVVERVDGIKVYKSTLFDSDTENES
ncbi:hypothetical protein ACX3PU_03535 [Chryseobacterium sp. A301]